VSLIWLVGCKSICAWRERLKIVAIFVSFFADVWITWLFLFRFKSSYDGPAYRLRVKKTRISAGKVDFFEFQVFCVFFFVFSIIDLGAASVPLVGERAPNSNPFQPKYLGKNINTYFCNSVTSAILFSIVNCVLSFYLELKWN
jgi:hypothetical protein